MIVIQTQTLLSGRLTTVLAKVIGGFWVKGRGIDFGIVHFSCSMICGREYEH